MRAPLVTLHGAARTVTGSRCELEIGSAGLLVECHSGLDADSTLVCATGE